MNIKLTGTYLLAPTNDTKVRIKISDTTFFITQVELKPPLLLAHANILAMKRKARCPVIVLSLKLMACSGTHQVYQ